MFSHDNKHVFSIINMINDVSAMYKMLNKMYVFSIINMINDVSAQLNKNVFSIINMINDVSARQNACLLNNKHDK